MNMDELHRLTTIMANLSVSQDALDAVNKARYSSRYTKDATESFETGVMKFIVYQYHSNVERLNKMFVEYRNSLMEEGIIPDYDKLVNDLDFIDTQKITDPCLPKEEAERVSELDEKIYEYICKKGIYALIPCFTRGRLRVSSAIDVIWEVEKFDIHAESYVMRVTVYADLSSVGVNIIVPLVSFRINIGTDENSEVAITGAEKIYAVSELYNQISLKRFRNWTQLDRKAWIQTFGKLFRFLEPSGDIAMSMEYINYMSTIIFRAFAGANYFLSQGRRKVVASEKVEEVNAFDPAAQAARKVRTVNMVSFASVGIPKTYTKRTIAHYKVAAWTVRGHTRTLSNGKVIYIPPRVYHRHCMGELADSVTPRPQLREFDDAMSG